MLDVEERFVIRDLYRKGVSISGIARRTGRDRKTIRKVINEPLQPERQPAARCGPTSASRRPQAPRRWALRALDKLTSDRLVPQAAQPAGPGTRRPKAPSAVEGRGAGRAAGTLPRDQAGLPWVPAGGNADTPVVDPRSRGHLRRSAAQVQVWAPHVAEAIQYRPRRMLERDHHLDGHGADPDYLIIGDLNACATEDPVRWLEAEGHTDLVEQCVGMDTYPYVFYGQAGYLDRALANDTMAKQVTDTSIWHINADEPSVLDYNTELKSAGQVISLYAADEYRSSHRAPVTVDLELTGVCIYLPIVMRGYSQP